MPKKPVRHGNLRGDSKLTAYECPSCHSLRWHPDKAEENVLCPFCAGGQPVYIGKISSETMIAKSKKALPESETLFAGPVRRLKIESLAGERTASPLVHEFHLVQGTGFRCMAYRNGQGKWRAAFDNAELPGDVRLLE